MRVPSRTKRLAHACRSPALLKQAGACGSRCIMTVYQHGRLQFFCLALLSHCVGSVAQQRAHLPLGSPALAALAVQPGVQRAPSAQPLAQHVQLQTRIAAVSVLRLSWSTGSAGLLSQCLHATAPSHCGTCAWCWTRRLRSHQRLTTLWPAPATLCTCLGTADLLTRPFMQMPDMF